MQNYSIYMPRLISKKEYFLPGHRACIGCGEALAVRLAAKAMGQNVVVVNATGCIEIIASQIPYTSWGVPWIHTLFENTAAVASGVEAGLKAMMRKDHSILTQIINLLKSGKVTWEDIEIGVKE